MSKISELSDGGSLLPTDFLIAVRSGGNVKVQADQTEFDRIRLGDNEKIELGNNQDLQIYHNGSDSYIDNVGAGSLIIQDTDGTGDIYIRPKSGQTAIGIYNDNTVELAHSGNVKLATTATGVDISGTATMDGLTVNSGAGDLTASFQSTDQFADLKLTDSGGSSYIRQSNGSLLLQADRDNASSNSIVQVSVDGVQTARFSSGGDISFFEDTGTTAKLHWSASDEKLTIDGDGGTVNSLTTAVSEAVLELNGNATVGSDSLYFGAMNANGDQYIQASNFAGTAANYDLLLNPYGGNVGIGCSPSAKLEVSTATANSAYLKVGTIANSSSHVIGSDIAGIEFYSGDTSGSGAGVKGSIRYKYGSTSGATTNMTFHTADVSGSNDVERMRIDSSGNLLVGKTAVDFGTVGAEILPTGVIRSAVGGGYCLMVNRKDSDGEIINFRKDGATVGSIFNSGTTMGVGSLDTGVLLANNIDAILPWNASTNAERDNAIDLGRSSGRFKDLYLSGHTRYNSEVYVGDGASISGSYSANDLLLHTDNNPIIFRPNGSEAARFDSNQNFLVGTTDSTPYNNNAGSTADNGIALSEAGWLAASRYQGTVAFFNRTDNDGDIAVFRKDGTTIGNINTASGYLQVQSAGGNFRWGANNTNQLSVDANQMYPMLDNALSLGGPTVRFKDAYLSGGIYLGGTAAANKLDDYEEGTWTPTVSGDATGVIESATVGGYYTKVGNQVTLYFNFRVTTNFTGSFVGGLPFQVDHGSMASSWITGGVVLGGASNTVSAGLQNGTSVMRLFNNNHLGDTHEPNTTMDYYRLQLSYRTDS